MNTKKKNKGKREKKLSGIVTDFMEKYALNPSKVAKGIRETQKVKFTEKTIRNWLNDESTLTFEKWDQIELYMNFIIDLTEE